MATIVFAVSTSFWLSMLALALLGASDAISVVIRVTLVQLETPDEMRGHVSAVNSLFVTGCGPTAFSGPRSDSVIRPW